ncbi:LOW QUALITY PROTEIN: uncharacterized protein LOC143179287 [Calliopsis andreniformis]|uniref:LOW QUALITY PROTEIN: uncharacterized protein LOC143179287 n=1 Tax=Calliopsis andreniformis TaxID=337506 RepID=UPI003FCEC1A2
MRNNKGLTFCLLLVIVLYTEVYAASGKHLIKKRNYSDQSVRGYLAERTFGGMKSARKSSTVNFDVVVQDGPIAVLQADITTHIAA